MSGFDITSPQLWRAEAHGCARAGKFREAINCYVNATNLSPNDASLRLEFGSLAGQLGLTDLAMEHLTRAIELDPTQAGAWNDLGQVFCLTRQVPRALDCFRKAGAIRPDYLTAANNRVYYAHFDPASTGQSIRNVAAAWAERYAEPITRAARPFAYDRSPDRRLRIGYVSPDLYEHPVGRFLHAILANHDRKDFEVTCYCGCLAPDATTAKLRSLTDRWRDTAQLSDDALAQQICADGIDILVDLSLHMGGNRLLVFARKLAPVQVTYLGYAGTSGMSAMDWRLSDPHLDPAGNDVFYTERTLRLPRSYWCYSSPSCAAEVGAIRPRRQEPITFACTNSFFKVSDAALSAWGEILRRVPDSRLQIHAQAGKHLADVLAKLRCDPSRVQFVSNRTLLDYFRGYHELDILLDPFPYAGGTTSCDAMWMGVPVLTLAGEIAVQRAGVSLLSNLALNDLIATNVEDYIRAAVRLASSWEKLSDLRATLRHRMESSILMNPREFMRDLEAAFRQIWRDHVLSGS